MDYFEEKAQQVSPEVLEAFGIKIYSRYGKADEIIEMLNFALDVATGNLAHYVKEVFYDSNACICNFEVVEPVKHDDPVAELIKAAALRHISQFNWLDGSVEEGRIYRYSETKAGVDCVLAGKI